MTCSLSYDAHNFFLFTFSSLTYRYRYISIIVITNGTETYHFYMLNWGLINHATDKEMLMNFEKFAYQLRH